MHTGKDPEGESLSARQRALIVELTRNPEIQAAARATGVGRTTAYRWLRTKEFAAELQRTRDETHDEALNAMKSMTMRAAETLIELMETPDERLRRAICNDVLRYALKVREFERIEVRLQAIEQQLQPQK